MHLTPEEQALLDGESGPATQKAMQILATLGRIYGAERMLPVRSVQIAGVSYDNLGEAGLTWLAEMAAGGGRARVFTTLNPAGMDVEGYQALGIPEDFAEKQRRVLVAFETMGVVTTCSCTPYLFGNLPRFGQHIAWAESSAVCYANSVLGARTNREGGPSALAAALTGRTPAYGYHLDENRRPYLHVVVRADLRETMDFGALGKAIGDRLQTASGSRVPYISGVAEASLEQLKSFCASIATFGGVALFHLPGITPEAGCYDPPAETLALTKSHLEAAKAELNSAQSDEIDFLSLGCPHLSLAEIQHIARVLEGKQVRKEFWITAARPVKSMADRMGYTAIIEAAGAKFATDTCCVVAPIKGRFKVMATDSAKACYYAAAKNGFATHLLSFEDVLAEAVR
ncbi:MAG: aconitase X catalytic domain-containing protein [Candidatus Cloacimonetes bacterium]|nr:aconitase X catalytic domain-containing protein [Candidatus Cloacimonadota bacterium]